MVIAVAPIGAVLLAVSVSRSLPVGELALHDAVTPLGSPDAAKLTLPLNPLSGLNETTDYASFPGSGRLCSAN